MLQMRLLGTHAAFKASREYFTTDRMTTEEFVPWLVTSEWDDRCNRTIERLIRQAGFRYQASVDHIDYSTERGAAISCSGWQGWDFMSEGRNVFITGSTGTGKSYLATALGVGPARKDTRCCMPTRQDLWHSSGWPR